MSQNGCHGKVLFVSLVNGDRIKFCQNMLNHPTDLSNALNAVDPQGRAPVFGCPKSMSTPAVILEKLFEK